MLYPFMKYYFLSRIKDILDLGRLPLQASFHRQAPPNTLRGSHLRDLGSLWITFPQRSYGFKCLGLSFCLNMLLVSC